MKEVIAALLVALSLGSGNAEADVNRGCIFLGDSRTVGLDNAVDIEQNGDTFVVAEVGKGYNWMVTTGLPEVVDIVKDNPKYNEWVLVTNLGVNDLGNVDKYAQAYEDLSELLDVYVVSVNPCSGAYNNLNSGINSFNEAMQELDSVSYIDTCSMLNNDGFSASDGLHYGSGTYGRIWDSICEQLSDVVELE